MLRGWNVSLDRDGTLEKISGKGMIWDAGAILEVPDPQCFEVKLSFPARAQGKRMPFILGITQTSFTGPIHEVPDLSKVFIEKNPTKCFVEFSKQNHKVHHCFIKEGSVKMEPMACMSAVSSLTLRYDSGSLTFSSEDKTSGPHNVPNTEYVPCVFLVEKNVPIVVHVSRKRKAAVEGLNDKLYRDRKFTDAEFVCMGRRIPVHRAVLSAASVVFERMWSSGMREAGSLEVVIQDCEPDVLEAAVKYMYKAELPSDCDPAPLFDLARKYELDNLAEAAGRRMLANLSADNALAWARIVHLHADAGDERAGSLWEKLYSKLASEPSLLRTEPFPFDVFGLRPGVPGGENSK
mmetsp:Transcript_128120/g.410725  ORF Transcript_128120/g.410725 Transcript_128120/m.410725 type:complete len:350 (-) Transcript_128120:203-1252(-)